MQLMMHERNEILSLYSGQRAPGAIPSMAILKLQVDCYSGRKADERPVRFRLGDSEYIVQEVLDRWYGPHDAFFKILASDGNIYILRNRLFEGEVEWYLESFRQLRS